MTEVLMLTMIMLTSFRTCGTVSGRKHNEKDQQALANIVHTFCLI